MEECFDKRLGTICDNYTCGNRGERLRCYCESYENCNKYEPREIGRSAIKNMSQEQLEHCRRAGL